MITYTLPPALIAQHPLGERASSRLFVVDRGGQTLQHRRFSELGKFLRAGDCLVLNDTKVIPARLLGQRLTGGQVELLLLRQGPQDGTYWCLSRPARRLMPGTRVTFDHGSLTGGIVEQGEGAKRLVQFEASEGLTVRLEIIGQMPLPPYIRRPPTPDDRIRYQTVYAVRPGAIAAPTAGLHFTQVLLDELRGLGVRIAFVTLHVGYGTFKPVTGEELASGRLHAEWYDLPQETAEMINGTKAGGGRVVAVGTTTCRVLETCVGPASGVAPGSGWTELFIRPGFEFRVIDGLVTNFHLPGTSLLMLVVALAGEALTVRAYETAVAERYRFYSYGDAMLIV